MDYFARNAINMFFMARTHTHKHIHRGYCVDVEMFLSCVFSKGPLCALIFVCGVLNLVVSVFLS